MKRIFVTSIDAIIEVGKAPEVAPTPPLPPDEQLRLKSLWLDLPRRLATTVLGPVTTHFFSEEVNEWTFRLLHATLISRTSGERYFEFNIFNLRIDFDDQRVTVVYVLDAATPDEVMPLERFRYLITSSPGESGTGT